MNWSRGLFRLWLVASAIWILVALITTQTLDDVGEYFRAQALRTDVAASELSVSPINNGVATVTFEGRIFEIETSGVQPSQSDEWAEFLRAAALMLNQDAAINNARLRLARADVLDGIWLAASPPLVVLVLGLSLLWAVRGFSGDRKK